MMHMSNDPMPFPCQSGRTNSVETRDAHHLQPASGSALPPPGRGVASDGLTAGGGRLLAATGSPRGDRRRWGTCRMRA
jgi:hypothetical protein